MKKIFESIAIIAMLAGAVSCQKEIKTEEPQPEASNIVITASIQEDSTKVTYTREEGTGGKYRWQPKWVVGDIVIGTVEGNPAKFRVKEILSDGKEAKLECLVGSVSAGNTVKLMYAPGATDQSEISDGKVVVDLSTISISPNGLNIVMTAQGTATSSELNLKFQNKMAVVAINSITGLIGTPDVPTAVSSSVSKVSVMGTGLYSSAVVDLDADTVTGRYLGALSYTGSPLTATGGSLTTPLYAAVVPSSTTIEVYTTTDIDVYYSKLSSKTLVGGKFYTTNRASSRLTSGRWKDHLGMGGLRFPSAPHVVFESHSLQILRRMVLEHGFIRHPDRRIRQVYGSRHSSCIPWNHECKGLCRGFQMGRQCGYELRRRNPEMYA